MPVDKFGRMSDLKTKDTGVSLTYINNNYVRSDGQTPLTGSLDMRGNTLYNVADPVNPQDVVTKVYVDNTKGSGVIGRKTKDGVSIKENLDFLGKQRIKNLPAPVDPRDAATREYVDQVAINHPFDFVDNTYQAKADLDLKENKIKNLCSPFEDGDAATKGYLDTQSVAFLKVEQGIYEAKADINLNNIYTVYNAKAPIEDGHITDKKYVDDQINLNSPFSKRGVGGYEAKENLYMRKNKILGLKEPLQDGEAATKKYVDDVYNNLLKQYIDEDDNIILNRNVDMEGNQVFNLPDPINDQDAVNKKYVDDLQTQHVDQKGNIKFGRNINLDNKRIFGMKDPTKPKEGANKQYVDDTITQRIQEEKNNFLPQDPATKNYVDEAIRGIAAGDVLVSKEGVFIKENGHYRATAPLDIDNQKMENIPDPVDEKDAANKKYIDGIVEALTLKQGLVRENGGFNLVDSYINMNFNRVRNIPYPHHNEDAVPRSFLDGKIKEVEEKIKKRSHIITTTTNYSGDLIKGEYQFSFGGEAGEKAGFLIPQSGRIKDIKVEFIGELQYLKPVITNGRWESAPTQYQRIWREEYGKELTDEFILSDEFNKELKNYYFSGNLLSFIKFEPKDKGLDNYVYKPFTTGSIITTYRCHRPGIVPGVDRDYIRHLECAFEPDFKNYSLSKYDIINIRTDIERRVKTKWTYLVTFLIELDPL